MIDKGIPAAAKSRIIVAHGSALRKGMAESAICARFYGWDSPDARNQVASRKATAVHLLKKGARA